MKLRHLKYILIALLVAYFASCSDSDDIDPTITEPVEESDGLPQKELRGVWLTTAWGKDWPMGDYTIEGQKALYIKYMETLVENNFNAVFVQVRSYADALYKSEYEPWNKNLTGEVNKDPGYDVLGFMIEEAHKRNIEFHAWINPYRIASTAGGGTFPELDDRIKPEWVKSYDQIQIYNPALPEVQDRVVDIVKEIMTKYDVDGIHIDDYFYPAPKAYEKDKSLKDKEDFENYGQEYATIEEFRFANVNKMVKRLHETVKEKPGVVFSVSPGSNVANNNAIYANTNLWCKEGWMDFIIPQLYSSTGSPTNKDKFNYRLHWFSQYAYDVPVLVGYALYKFGDPEEYGKDTQFAAPEELQKQFDFAATRKKVKGGIMYTAGSLHKNLIDIMSVIKKQYANPAVRPVFGEATLPKPEKPSGLSVAGGKLTWTVTQGLYYAVYQETETEVEGVMTPSIKLLTITNDGSYDLTDKGSYFVTAINRDNTESERSDAVKY